MSLIQNTLFGKVDKVEKSLLRLRDLEPEEGYYLAFSGGKDSCVIKTLADMAGVKYDAHYNRTGIDPPELVYFIRDNHSDVIVEKPKMSYFKMLIKERFPPLSGMPWCCKLLKEGHGKWRTVMLGVRQAESNKRRERQWCEICTKDTTITYVNPIVDWSNLEVWEFIRRHNIPVCSLYSEGWTRIGCLFCPKKTPGQRRRDVQIYPRFAKAFRRAFKRLWEFRIAHDLPLEGWDSSDDWFCWWINKKTKTPEGQTCFAFDN